MVFLYKEVSGMAKLWKRQRFLSLAGKRQELEALEFTILGFGLSAWTSSSLDLLGHSSKTDTSSRTNPTDNNQKTSKHNFALPHRI